MSDVPDEMPADAFLATMPWWVVLGRDRTQPGDGEPADVEFGGRVGAAGYLVLDADGSTCLAVFTDEDLAQRFVKEADFDGGPLPVETPDQFWQLARRLPTVCTYAVFDPPPRIGGRARWVVPLGEVLKALAAVEGEPEGESEEDEGSEG